MLALIRQTVFGCYFLPQIDSTNPPPYIRPMPIAESLKITADEYRLLPEGGPRYQLIEGELHMAPSPNQDDPEKPGKVHSANSVFTSPVFPGLKFRAAEIFRG